ncbi:hypothetical protein QYE76_056380 [Lolium multiflorum]|uniref:tRNA-splicing endonuclease subunit Sen54 N-terminal domain-containing protein n=1 Tax=Lolium multiflorum TaxID=4521 RepID=A0AAD8T1I6_LOLMU|nr:hypothetical protein QYE76_056380 [Lolium multiflorum]
MAAAPRDRRRRGRAPGAASAAAAEDDGEEHHLNPFLSDEAPSSSRIQFRNVASRARWVEEAGEAKVLDSKGKLWLTTGVTRAGKLYYNVEEIGDKPPSRDELETVENKFEGIPLKFCQVDNGRISFLTFDNVTLPSLP